MPADAPGLRVERQSRVDSRGAALVQLDGCEVGADALIGALGEGLPVLEAAVDRATVGLCAEMLGSMSEAFARTLDYLKHRIQFGVPIGSFQALKHRAAELFIQIELCRSARDGGRARGRRGQRRRCGARVAREGALLGCRRSWSRTRRSRCTAGSA